MEKVITASFYLRIIGAVLYFLFLFCEQAHAQLPVAPNQYQPVGNYSMGVAPNLQPMYVPSWIGANNITTTTKTLNDSSETLQTIDATNNSVTVTLSPAINATSAAGKIYAFKAINVSHSISIVPKAGDTIDGASSLALSTLNQCAILEADGTHTWRVISTGSGGGGGGSPGGSSGQIQYNNGGTFGGFTAAGDATIDPTTGQVTFANTGVTAGAYTNTNITVDAKGRITVIASGSAGGVASVSGTAGNISSTGGSTPVLDLVSTAVTPSSYGPLSNITVDAKGRLTAVATVTALPNGTTTTTQSPADNSTKTASTAYADAAATAAVATGLPLTTIGDTLIRGSSANQRLPGNALVLEKQLVQWGDGTTPTVPQWLPTPLDLNLDGRFYPNLKLAMANVRNNTGPCRILWIGDSTFVGTTMTGATPGVLSSPPGVATTLINQGNFLPASHGIFSVPASNINDTNYTLGANWRTASSGGGFAGFNMWAVGTGGTGTLSLTPTFPFNTMDIYAIGYGDEPAMPFLIDGVNVANVAETGSGAFFKQTASAFALATHTLTVGPGSDPTKTCGLLGWDLYDNTKQSIHMINGGVQGSETSQWIPASAGAGFYTILAPHLAIVNLGINDVFFSVPLSTTVTNLQTIITTLQAQNTDVILVAPHPITGPSLDPLTQAIRDLAISNNCGFVNLYYHWNATNTGINASMYTGGTGSHCNNLGGADEGAKFYNVLRYIIGGL